ncbi:Phosphotransferase enzyme family protein [Ceratocystis lukuohia]|uniref:Phosphotransferase enzyme family protein n=1 Tax=Ceratocystis lukuohia TaxID=2019550 RepID=A0ABR4M9V8_9PEZI
MGLKPNMPSPTQLPYFCNPTELTDTLPTLDEIEHTAVRLLTMRNPQLDCVVLVRGCFVVKYGKHVAENEGQALLFLAHHSCIPIPQLYAMYYEASKLFLVMSNMPSTQLSLVWEGLSGDEKQHILKQLRSIWTYLQSIPALPAFFSGVCGGPLQHRFFLWTEPDIRITRPFYAEEDLGRALALHSRKNWEGNERQPQTPAFFACHLPTVLRGHPGVLTHGDLQRKNILVEQICVDGTSEGERWFRVSAVLDWEDAGWYPSYWEYAALFVDFEWHDDWPEKVESILDPYLLEAAMLKLM